MSIVIHIRRADLTAYDACAAGLALYDAILAHQTEERARRGLPARDRLVLRWTMLHTLMLVTSHGESLSWCVDRGILPAVSLRDAYLARADLAGANLADANLAGADLARADLAGANLTRAYLARADLAGANLTDAYLAGADLARADLAGADLAGANLADANLADAYLAGANRATTDAPILGWRAVPASCGCCARLAREVTP